jgi:hypothetical protein
MMKPGSKTQIKGPDQRPGETTRLPDMGNGFRKVVIN